MPSIRSRFYRPLIKVIFSRFYAVESIPELRAVTEKTLGLPIPLRRTTVLPETALPGEWIVPDGVPPTPVILYLHGGGWVLGWTGGHRRMVAHLCRAAESRALSVDYRLAPEHPFPAALDDCLAAYRWLLERGIDPRTIVIGGDSAGGHLTLTTLVALREAGDPLPAAAFCISPVTDLTASGETLHTADDPMLTTDFLLSCIKHYADGHDRQLGLLSPLHADLHGLPPLLIQAGEDEILFSDAVRLTERARIAGAGVTLQTWPGMWHVWHAFTPYLPEAHQAVAAIGEFVHRELHCT